MANRNTHKISRGLFWKLLERFGLAIVQFVTQIVLARLLAPEHYGALSIMIIFTNLASVVLQNGFNTALIQNKDVDEDDYSSVFWILLAIVGTLYTILFFTAPIIANFYDMSEIILPFRVLSLVLFPNAFNSIQLAKSSRELDFKKVFFSNVGAIFVSGIFGIVLAYLGGGLWALVAQTLCNAVVACIVMWFTVHWRPRLVCNFVRVKVLFSFGWKVFVSSMIETLYQDLRSLVIGKKYDSATLGYYNRGKQFPQLIIHAVNGTVQSVMLPAMSAEQENKEQLKNLMRRSIMLSAYIVFPIMAGLAGIATPLVSLLLTDKWLFCVPYMQIYCFTLAFYPVHSCNLQAINAVGRSDIFLKLELIKKSYGIIALVIAVFCFQSPIAIAMTGVFTTFISCFVNAYPNKKLIGYSYFEQIKDILPSFMISVVMLGGVLLVGQLALPTIAVLALQVLTGIVIYVLISAIFRVKSFMILMNMGKKVICNRKKT